MESDPFLLSSALDGLDFGFGILEVNRENLSWNFVHKNKHFVSLCKKFDSFYFFHRRVLGSHYKPETLYLTNGQILELEFSLFEHKSFVPELFYLNCSLKDTTEKWKVEEEVAWRLRFEFGISSTIQILLSKPTFKENLAQAIFQLLYFTDMDTVFFLKRKNNTFSFEPWANERKSGHFPLIPQNLVGKDWFELGLGRWFAKLSRGKVLYMDGNKPLPKERWVFGDSCKNFLLVPVLIEGNLSAVLGFQRFRKASPMQKENRLVYQTLGRWFALFLQRDLALEDLRDYKSKLETIILERTLDLSKLKEELKSAYEVKSKFIAQMSHELRTPLNSIIGFSKLIQIPESDSQGREYLRFIYEGGKRLLQMIQEILTLLRLDSGELKLQIVSFPLEELVKESISLLKPQADAAGIPILYESYYPQFQLTSDPRKIQQILLNLLSNAIKYAPQSPQIRVSLRVWAGFVYLSIEDRGPGIEESKQKEIFESFTRLEEDGKTEGSGLGLAISQRMAEALGGSLTLTSEKNQGSLFTLKLPFSQ